jgi:hypothetical protein
MSGADANRVSTRLLALRRRVRDKDRLRRSAAELTEQILADKYSISRKAVRAWLKLVAEHLPVFRYLSSPQERPQVNYRRH